MSALPPTCLQAAPAAPERPAFDTLERNYRSMQPILAASNAVMAEAAERFTKDLWTEHAMAWQIQQAA